MKHVVPSIRRLVAHDEGQDLLEYGLLAVLVAVVVMAGVTALGQTIQSVFWEVIQRGF